MSYDITICHHNAKSDKGTLGTMPTIPADVHQWFCKQLETQGFYVENEGQFRSAEFETPIFIDVSDSAFEVTVNYGYDDIYDAMSHIMSLIATVVKPHTTLAAFDSVQGTWIG